MAKSIKCPACNMYYNGSIYTKCPYCKSDNTETISKSIEKKEAGNSKKEETKRGLFHRSKSTKPKVKEQTESLPKIGSLIPADISGEPIEEFENVKITGNMPETEPLDFYDTLPMQEDENRTSEQKEQSEPVLPQPAASMIQEGALPDQSATMGQPAEASLRSLPVQGREVKAVQSVPKEHPVSLREQISRSNKTVGTYIYKNNGETVQPLVGWLVGIKGPYLGEGFSLKKGRNRIGRAHDMDVKLLNDDSVSRECVAVITYDIRTDDFCLIPGESESLCYVDGAALYERKQLHGYESIEFGDRGINCFKFVPFCGKQFAYSEYEAKEDEI